MLFFILGASYGDHTVEVDVACATAQGLLQEMLLPWESPEAEFLDDIKTKVLRVFLLAIHSHLYCTALP